MSAFRKEVTELSSTVCTLGGNTIKFHFLYRLMEDDRRFGDVSFLELSAYGQFTVHIKRAYQGSSMRFAARIQETVMYMERQRSGEQHAMSTEPMTSSQSIVHLMFSRCMEEGGRLLQPIWSVCLDDTVGYVARVGIEKDSNKNATILLNMFAKHGVELQADLVKERLQDQSYAPSFSSVYLSVPRSGFVALDYTACLQDYVKEENFISDRPELRNQFQRVFPCY